MGFATSSQALGMLTGTLGAGVLVGIFDWQAVFFGRIPFLVLAVVLAFKFLPEIRLPHRLEGQGPSFDAAGAVTLLGALICLVIGLRIGRSEGWTSPVVLTLLALSPLFLAGFWQAEQQEGREHDPSTHRSASLRFACHSHPRATPSRSPTRRVRSLTPGRPIDEQRKYYATRLPRRS